MKICVTKTLADNVYISSIATSKFSEADKELMADFGVPVVQLGGDFGGDPAEDLGNVDLSGGHDWDAVNQAFIITVNGEGPTTITLDADCADLDEVVEHINAVLADEGFEDLAEAYASTNFVGLRTVHEGDDQEMILAVGTPDALATMGITAGTYEGDGAPDFTLTSKLAEVDTQDTPMVQRFDARDERFSGAAQLSADLWTETIVARIKSAMDVLRVENDSFSGETCETY